MKNILIFTLALSSAVAAQERITPAAPVFSIFELGIQQGKTATYEEMAKKNITASIADEAGTLGMYSIRQKANVNIAYMVEIYADNDAYKSILSTHNIKLLFRTPRILLKRITSVRFDTVPQFLGDKKSGTK